MTDQPRITRLPTGPGTDTWKDRIVSAIEIVHGRAVVVIATDEEGAIGIGNLVRRTSQSPEDARKRCMAHAVGRIQSLQQARARQAVEPPQ